MTKDEMVRWFKSAPNGSRHERTLWATCKIARLTGASADEFSAIDFDNFWGSVFHDIAPLAFEAGGAYVLKCIVDQDMPLRYRRPLASPRGGVAFQGGPRGRSLVGNLLVSF